MTAPSARSVALNAILVCRRDGLQDDTAARAPVSASSAWIDDAKLFALAWAGGFLFFLALLS